LDGFFPSHFFIKRWTLCKKLFLVFLNSPSYALPRNAEKGNIVFAKSLSQTKKFLTKKGGGWVVSKHAPQPKPKQQSFRDSPPCRPLASGLR
jgi:hypothetical protein